MSSTETQETLETQESKTTSSTTVGWNKDAFNGEMAPAGGIKAILGKTVHITGRKSFKVDHNPTSKFDKPDADGKVTKYIVTTQEKFPIVIKAQQQQVSNWYVSEGHYNQLSRLAPDGKAETLDAMLAEGNVTPEIIPCKVKGGGYGKYFTWLTPEAYAKAVNNGDIYKE